METTAQKLEKMEAAPFEKLCGEALRYIYPPLVHLIPSGINAEGRTIRSPSDGFCFVEKDHFAMIHITINGSNLNAKWLSKGEPKGDLVKAIDQADKLHEQNPDYRFTAYLVSNRRVAEDLALKVKSNDTDYFSSIILEQTELTSFLDHHPEGQYLRKRYLGIDGERISMSLLRDIAHENLRRYSQEIYIDEVGPAKLLQHKMIEEQLGRSRFNTSLLVGESGFGKSTVCNAIMRNVSESGRIAYRIKPAIIEAAGSLEDALYRQLLDDSPKIYIDINELPTFFNNAVLIIDDINKSVNPSALLDKIISWSVPRDEAYVSIICPVWPHNQHALNNHLKKESRVQSISVKRLSFYDCSNIITQRLSKHGIELTSQQIHALIVDTGFDPLLLDISIQLIEEGQQYSGNTATKAIINFTDEKIRQISNRYHFPVSSIRGALVKLGSAMLRNRKLEVQIPDINEWLGEQKDASSIVHKLAAERQLFFFDDNGKCFFRHDRVRDHILTLAATEMLTHFDDNNEALSDPFFAEIIGAALAFQTVPRETLQKLIDVNPLALFISLKYLQSDIDTNQFIVTLDVVRQWNEVLASANIPKAITTAISAALTGFDTKQINAITTNFPASPELYLARFRNGNWLAAVHFFAAINYFYPESTTYWFDTILAHVKAIHLEEVVGRLASTLPSKFKTDGIQHGYTLAGFIGDKRLLQPLMKSWDIHASPKHYISYLWAILKCSTAENSLQIRETLAYWSTLSEEDKRYCSHKRLGARAVREQVPTLDWAFSDEQIAVIAEIASDKSMREIAALLFTYVDSPAAMNVVLDFEQDHKTRNDFRHDRSNERWDKTETRRRLSSATIHFLQQQFTDRSLPDMRRYIAWRFWTGSADEEMVLKLLQGILPDDTVLFTDSVYWRVNHGDKSAFSHLRLLIADKPFLIRMLDSVWSGEVRDYFISWLDIKISGNDHEALGRALELIVYVDNADTEKILVDHWEVFKRLPKGILAALFLSTEQTLRLADIEIRRLGFDSNKRVSDFLHGNLEGVYITVGGPDPLTDEEKQNALFLGEVFRSLYMHFFVRIKGKGERITKGKLEGLLPYLSLIDSVSLLECAQDARRLGLDGLFDQIFSYLPRHLKQRFRLSTDDLLRDLRKNYSEMKKNNSFYFAQWVEEMDKYGVTGDMVSMSLKRLWNEHPDENAFFIIALVLDKVGTRKEISLLESFALDIDSGDKTENQRKNTFWLENTIFKIKRRSLN